MTETVLGIVISIVFVAFYILFDKVSDLEEEVTDLKRDVNGIYVREEWKKARKGDNGR